MALGVAAAVAPTLADEVGVGDREGVAGPGAVVPVDGLGEAEAAAVAGADVGAVDGVAGAEVGAAAVFDAEATGGAG